MICIIDYGLGNLGSVLNMFKKLKVDAFISGDKAEIEKADKLLLPGVGAFKKGMDLLREKGLIELLNHKVLEEKTPVLGICLGMQLLMDHSEEGDATGLGWIKGNVIRFPKHDKLKVPHMGWNVVEKNSPSQLTENFESEMRFYFVHSFYVEAQRREDSLLRTEYGLTFDSGVGRDNIFGVQFHPEKSHKFGMKLLTNFSKV